MLHIYSILLQLSGCSPEIPALLKNIENLETGGYAPPEPDSIISKAISSILSNGERDGQEDVTVIGEIECQHYS